MKPISRLASVRCAAVFVTATTGCSSSSGGGVDAGRDALVVDAPAEVVMDAGHDADAMKKEASSTCAPGSLADFKPTDHGQIGPYANQCTVTQLTDVVADCFAPSATMPACDSWVNDMSNNGCLACWAGNVTAANWAPVLYVDNPGQSTYDNVAGCFALSDPTQAACAKTNEYAFECAIAACETSCPVPVMGEDMQSAIDAFTQCFGAAACGECASYTNPAQDCGSAILSGGGPAAYCTDINMNSADFLKYAILACGPPPSDAGAADAQ
jgi:hypothetical protein